MDHIDSGNPSGIGSTSPNGQGGTGLISGKGSCAPSLIGGGSLTDQRAWSVQPEHNIQAAWAPDLPYPRLGVHLPQSSQWSKQTYFGFLRACFFPWTGVTYTAAAMLWESTNSLTSRCLIFPVENPTQCRGWPTEVYQGRLVWFWSFFNFFQPQTPDKIKQTGPYPAPLFLCSVTLNGHVIGSVFLFRQKVIFGFLVYDGLCDMSRV